MTGGCLSVAFATDGATGNVNDNDDDDDDDNDHSCVMVMVLGIASLCPGSVKC